MSNYNSIFQTLSNYIFVFLISCISVCDLSAQVYEQAKDKSNHPLSEIKIKAGHSAPFFSDVDMDGDMDLLSGGADGKIFFYENIGTEENAIFIEDNFSKFFKSKGDIDLISDGLPGTNSKIGAIDFDDDGDVDYFCAVNIIDGGYEKAAIYYFKNIPSLGKPSRLKVITPQSKDNPFEFQKSNPSGLDFELDYAPAFFDITYDGFTEILCGNKSGKVGDKLYKGNANGYELPIKLPKYVTPCIGDVNGDGDRDLLCGAIDGQFYFFYGSDYDNLGPHKNPFKKPDSLYINPFANISVDSFSTPYLVDIDGDGDLDLFSGQKDGSFTHYINISTSDYLTVATDNFLHLDANIIFDGSASVNGNLGIGKYPTDDRLSVNGTVSATEYNTQVNNPPDYVFYEDYPLLSLDEIQAHIDAHGHLPEIPSAANMEANGVQLGEMSMSLLRKVEELTLHIIALEKRIKELEYPKEAISLPNTKN